MNQPRLRYVSHEIEQDDLAPMPFPGAVLNPRTGPAVRAGDDILAVIDRMQGALKSLGDDLNDSLHFPNRESSDGDDPRPAA